MENYQIISLQIADLRLLLSRIGLKKPEDSAILKSFEELAIFIITNFEIPSSHKKYIQNNLGFKAPVEDMVEELIKNNSEITEYFDIELKLRALECYFSWGKPLDIRIEKLMFLKYLIAKLHSLLGDKKFTT